MTANEQRMQTKKATKERHDGMTVGIIEVKISENKLNKSQRRHLDRIFPEAKWFSNHMIGFGEENDIFKFDDKIDVVNVMIDKDRNFEERKIEALSSQMKQSLADGIKQDIKNLSKKKEKRQKVGRLKFKKDVATIPLKQFGVTYRIIGKTHVALQGMRKPMRVRGLDQLYDKEGNPLVLEFANGNLVRRPSGTYIQMTTYSEKIVKEPKRGKPDVGIDLGVGTHLTLSSGQKIMTHVPILTKRAAQSLSRKVKGSKNWLKAKRELNLQYERQDNIKYEIKKKITSWLSKEVAIIFTQNDDIAGWQKKWFGKQIQRYAIGGIKAELRKGPHTLMIDRWKPTTKQCRECDKLNVIPLSQRMYVCDCGYVCDRDIHSANRMMDEGKKLGLLDLVPIEHREPNKPIDSQSADAKPAKRLTTDTISTKSLVCKWVSIKQEAPIPPGWGSSPKLNLI